MKKGSNIIKIFVIILIIILVIFLGWLIIIKSGGSKRVNATNKLNDLAKTFYSYYYEENKLSTEEATKQSLSQWKDIGITINLKNLKIYMDSRKTEDYSLFNNCDEDKTKIVVYPISPYGENDFKTETSLICK